MTTKFDVNKLVELVRNGNLEEAQALVNQEQNVLRIYYDPCAESPRVNSNLGSLYIEGNSKYNDYNETNLSHDEIIEFIADSKNISLPIYCYEHGDVSYSTKPFSCKWDSGLVGFIYTTPEKIKEYGLEDRTPEEIKLYLEGEIESYSQWANGEIMLFNLEDQFGNVIDSCGGFYNVEDIADHIEPKDLNLDTQEQLIEHIKSIDIEAL